MNDHDRMNRTYQALAIAATEMFGAWLDSLPDDEREDLVAEFHNGAGAGIRLLFADDKRMAQLTFLRLARSGDVDTIGEVVLARAK